MPQYRIEIRRTTVQVGSFAADARDHRDAQDLAQEMVNGAEDYPVIDWERWEDSDIVMSVERVS